MATANLALLAGTPVCSRAIALFNFGGYMASVKAYRLKAEAFAFGAMAENKSCRV
ncbi:MULTISPECIES: hypothetical protein [Caballeronia]|uniref:Uncharacterized protein n=1 Tax=Caballeronia novacaledonica TaxID=1544861 RepID=A0AA37MQ34_9BURK|nr:MULTISPECIES: hypothetical protein [Caballeronia]MDR5743556.1 hypothetical protein [Caballeronia sp. LZ029]GJH25831.1 hypothetical protein CBA19CS42_14965 [Caballeronia novacaledonica]